MPEKPFPRSELDINVLLQGLAVKVPPNQATLGLTAGDITALTENAANFDYLVNVAQQVSDSKQAFTDFKNDMFYGEPGFSPALPTFPTIVTPENRTSGIVPWLRAFIKRIKAAPGYTEQMGEDFGFIVDNPDPFNPGDIIPELKVKAMVDDQIEIKFSKQGLDALRLDWRPAGTEDWQNAGVFTSSPAIYQHNSPGKNPQAIELRGRLLEKNNPVSQYSPVYQVVTIP